MADHPGEPKGFMAHALSFVKLKKVDPHRRDHLQDVWLLLEGAGISDPTTLMAPFMLEVLETTTTDSTEIETRFGPAVVKLIAELRHDPGLDEPAWRALQLERAARLSEPAKIVLFAEAISNLGKLREDCSIKENQAYIDWVEKLAEIFAGINIKLDVLCDRMIDVARDLVEQARKQRLSQPSLVRARGRKPRKPKKRRFDSPFLRINAEPGVKSVVIEWSEGWAHVTIDGRQIVLPPLSGHALDVLRSFSPDGDDGFPLLLDKQVFGMELGGRTERTYEDPHHINVVLYRLQDQLSKNAVNPLLVEMTDDGRVRLRVRRTTPSLVTVNDPEELVTIP